MVGAILLGAAAFLALRGYRASVPEELRAGIGGWTVRCDAPLYDALDDGPPGGSLTSPARRAALAGACDQTSMRLLGCVVCLVAGGALLWTSREAVAEELF